MSHWRLALAGIVTRCLARYHGLCSSRSLREPRRETPRDEFRPLDHLVIICFPRGIHRVRHLSSECASRCPILARMREPRWGARSTSAQLQCNLILLPAGKHEVGELDKFCPSCEMIETAGRNSNPAQNSICSDAASTRRHTDLQRILKVLSSLSRLVVQR